ncbi:3-dehydroquinate synthase [Mycobacterium tuberculosis]|nr:3-dehydroquinate synthase [Mycobacterium tuberculosis]
MGGGATSNTAGMAAALLYRGVRLIHIPTTPLGQADAAIGLKQAVNSAQSKNIYGLYHQPLAVLNDLDVTSTAPTGIIRDGLAEIAKVGLAASTEIYELLLSLADHRLRTILPEPELGRVVHLAAATKLRGLPDDPFETADLRLMELGHIAAHALEAASGYSISHGAAVAAGLIVEAEYSTRQKIARDGDLVAKYRHLMYGRLRFRSSLPDAPDTSRFVSALAGSNKRGAHGIEITLPVRLGQTCVATLRNYGDLAEAYRVSLLSDF